MSPKAFITKLRNYLKNNQICIFIYSLFFFWKDDSQLDYFYLKFKMILSRNVYKIKQSNIVFYLPYFQTDYIQKRIIANNDFYEKDRLEFIFIKWKNGLIGKAIQNNIVLDIGANIGNHTLYFLSHFPKCRVICFEPIKDTFKILERNIELNHFSQRTSLYNKAIGASKGRASIEFYNPLNIGSTSILENQRGNIDIITIDELSFNENVSFVKIDVEGFEKNVIDGMINTIKKYHPFIMIEIRHCYFSNIKAILSSENYKYFELENNPEMGNYLFYVEA